MAMSATGLLLLGAGYWFMQTPSRFFYPSLIMLLVSTVALYRLLVKIRETKPDLFVPIYLGSISLKLIAYCVYVFVMVQQEPKSRVENVVFFLIGCGVCTAVETVFLYRVVTR
jgi:hypothetical protein